MLLLLLTFSSGSVFGVHTEEGSFLKCTVSKFMPAQSSSGVSDGEGRGRGRGVS